MRCQDLTLRGSSPESRYQGTLQKLAKFPRGGGGGEGGGMQTLLKPSVLYLLLSCLATSYNYVMFKTSYYFLVSLTVRFISFYLDDAGLH